MLYPQVALSGHRGVQTRRQTFAAHFDTAFTAFRPTLRQAQDDAQDALEREGSSEPRRSVKSDRAPLEQRGARIEGCGIVQRPTPALPQFWPREMW
ncbi:MAG: hypothetical protein CEE40_06110 [Chloroflexi bacterium B3_Chlor]|nr:MAG: hypothetical protein CEE40_06110 [Chloroflexi bacterium B3_Chlor]